MPDQSKSRRSNGGGRGRGGGAGRGSGRSGSSGASRGGASGRGGSGSGRKRTTGGSSNGGAGDRRTSRGSGGSSAGGTRGSSGGAGGGKGRAGDGARSRRSEPDKRSTTSGSAGSRSGGSGGRSGGRSSAGRSGGRDETRSKSRRAGTGDQRDKKPGPRRDLKGAAVNLPNWIVEELVRVTPPERVAGALEALGEASVALEEGRYHAAQKHALRAKNLSPRDTTTREVLALSAYRLGEWDASLKELRTYRRLTGDTTHLPIEMDVLRALDRPDDVRKAWEQLAKRGGKPAVMAEGKVVYAAHLLDLGRPREALEVTKPFRLNSTHTSDFRVWYVAARASAALGDVAQARRLRNAILENDPGFPGIDELEKEIARAGT